MFILYSNTLQSILINFNNAGLIIFQASSSSNLFTRAFENVTDASPAMGTAVIFMVYNFTTSLNK